MIGLRSLEIITKNQITERGCQTTLTKKAANQVREYLSGKRKYFTLPIEISLPPFYKKVLSQVSKIPYGSVSTYKNVAKMSGNIKASRAVGTANSSNPLPIIIPCHRVITSNGSIGGYNYGLKMKKKLLKHEGYILN